MVGYIKQLVYMARLAWEAFGSYRWHIALLTVLGFVSGILEGIGINAIIPLLSFIIGTGPTANLDFISQAIQSFFAFLHIPFQFRYLLVFIVSLFVLKAVAIFVFTYITIKITAGYEKDMRSLLFGKTLGAKWEYLIGQKLGHLETILMTNVRFSAEALERISNMLMLTSGLVVYTLIAINISPKITLFTLILGSVLFLAFKPLLRIARYTSRDILATTKKVAHYVNENVVGIKTVKSTSSEAAIDSFGDGLFETLRKLRIKSTLLRTVGNVLMQPIGLIFISIIFAFSFKTEGFVFSAFLAVVYLIQRIFSHFQALQTGLHKLNEAAPYLKNVVEYRKELATYAEQQQGGKSITIENSFAFNDVYFSYKKEKQAVLRGVSFSIPKGYMVGLIGPSGSGKTTVVDLALKLFSPEKGTITVDGKDIATFATSEWRKHIGYVSQDIFLTNDTIENNIRFYDSSLSKKAVIEAAKKAHIYDFIKGTEHGFQTYIGERGILLSAGQRQRIVIARVLAGKPRFLILDEATSALDNESEVQIQKVIEELHGTVTTLVVAHRLSTIVNSDTVLVLKEGKIVEAGDPKRLLKDSQSYFHKMYNIRK